MKKMFTLNIDIKLEDNETFDTTKIHLNSVYGEDNFVLQWLTPRRLIARIDSYCPSSNEASK